MSPAAGEWFWQAGVSAGRVQCLGLRLTIACCEVDPTIAAGRDLCLQGVQQAAGVPLSAESGVGPDALEFGGFQTVDHAEAPECAAGHRLPVEHTDQ